MTTMVPSKLALYERLHEQIDAAADRAVALHNKLLMEGLGPLLEKNRHYRDNMWDEGSISSVSGLGVEIEWDEYARGCRTDGGSYRIPTAAICDSTHSEAIKKIVEKKIKKIMEAVAYKVEYEKAQKIAQFERLKKELGEE